MSAIYRRRIEAMISQFPNGITIKGLVMAFDKSPAPSTIRAHLKKFQNAELVRKEGRFWIPDKKIVGRVCSRPQHKVPESELRSPSVTKREVGSKEEKA